MKIYLRVEKSNGEFIPVVTNAADLVKFENEFDRSIARIETELKYTDLLWLAWTALTRLKQTKDDFDKWLEDIDGIEAEDSPK